eukprot:gnl/MRDRNA2_/MRDRNA2_61777_c0_seq1.p1 gnl/MRDRNA2_/MRDRNA2_61777_c0~~gnl/MRDRNA2_/MRDRNA2_61777_c0_seq1.p1  ORF type:complete len:258 (+),score=45.76 gnl/MRDRNA2_/MRDRNA2_61777_c0_seq1:123-896(+)
MVEPHVMYERLFVSEESKDVTIKMSNGTLLAHSVILGAASDALKGMLSNGIAKTEKTLSWEEHPVEVGSFVLRLVYTGSIEECSDWEKDTDGHAVIPLKILLGGLRISAFFQIIHLIKPLCEAAERRISTSTFNEIYSAAIAIDLTALRQCCFSFAKEQALLSDGTEVEALKLITASGARVPKGERGTVQNGIITWQSNFVSDVSKVRHEIIVIKHGSLSIEAMYEKGELAPEVMFELVPLYGCRSEPPEKKLRRFL